MSNKIKVIIILLLMSNVVLFFLYKNASDESEFRLKMLYWNFENGLILNDTGLINAKNGHGQQHLLTTYAHYYNSSTNAMYFLSRINLPFEEVRGILDFYTGILEEWIVTDYEPTEEEYENMMKDFQAIHILTSYRHKEHTLLDWTENEFDKNIKELKSQLILFKEKDY
ncbi:MULTISPECIES: hypothetical protein [Bacillus]|uniref:hypothetical protein n=1 Tax=Bacillus TaxID=1386 RepID=UPI000BB8EDEE|nr:MULTISPECIES: hypothetical protein [Bacillus]